MLPAMTAVVVLLQAEAAAPRRVARVDTVIPAEGRGYALSRIAGLVRLATDQIAVLSVGDDAVHVLSPGGILLRSIGRRGSGPGEFRSPRAMGRVGDSLWVWDLSLSRVTVFGPDGLVARTVSVPVSGRGVLFQDGTVGVFPARNFGSRLRRDDTLVVSRVAKDGAPEAILRVWAPYRVLRYASGGSQTVGVQPFDDATMIAPAFDGSGAAVVEQTGGRHGRPAFVVTRITHRGDTLYRRAIEYLPVAVTRAEVDSVVGMLTGPVAPAQRASLRESVRAALYVPRTLPPVTGLLVGYDGTLWIRREERRTETSIRWLVLDQAGRIDYEVVLDRRFIPLDARGDTLWGALSAADGTASPARFVLGPRRRGSRAGR